MEGSLALGRALGVILLDDVWSGRRAARFVTAMTAVGALACGGNGSAPTPPTSLATPTPAPTATPNPFAAACGTPLPAFADSYGMGIKVQLEPTRNKKILNVSPQVRNADYCATAGIPNSTICNTRREDNPERVPCDHYLSGISETGRPGPNWFQEVSGRLLRCGGLGGVPEEAPDCRLKPENQYLIDVTAGGQFVACGGTGAPLACGGCLLDESTFGVIHRTPAGLCRPS
jgi:hypothetical protein